MEIKGPYPGLGAALYAFGIDLGNLIASSITENLKEDQDPWDEVEKIFKNPKILPDKIANQIGKNHQKAWERIKDERKALLKLLSRFEINREQAELDI